MSQTELTKSQAILRPKLIILTASIAATALGVVVWSIFARIPTKTKAIGYVLPAYQVKAILSKTDGKISLLSNKGSNQALNKIKQINSWIEKEDFWRRISAFERDVKNNVFTPINYDVRRKINEIHTFIDNLEDMETFELKTSLTNSSDTINVDKGVQRVKCFSEGSPIYFIDNEKKVEKVKQDLQSLSERLIKLRSSFIETGTLKSTYEARARSLETRLSRADELVAEKLLPPATRLSIQADYLRSNESYLDLLTKQKTLLFEFSNSLENLSSSFTSFDKTTFVKADSNLCIIQQLSPNHSLVSQGQLLGMAVPRSYITDESIGNDGVIDYDFTANQGKTGIKDIPFFYLAENDKGIKAGNKVVVYPRNVPKNTYGGIKGEVSTSRRVLEDKEQTKWIIGFRNVIPYENSNKGDVLYYGLIRLEENPNNPSGYKWTSGNGPDYSINVGTTTDIDITVSSAPPISNLLPFIKSITGQ